jgi:hypothetical protein
MQIFVPRRLDHPSVLAFIQQLQQVERDPGLAIDFRIIEYVFPFPTLVVAVAIRDLIDKRHALGLGTQMLGADFERGALSYLKFFGFFQFLGMPTGNAPNQAPGGTRYLPITVITKSELEINSGSSKIQQAIDSLSDRLARVIFPTDTQTGPAMMLSYCFREVIRNTFEHAEVEECCVMAQKWYDGEAEIAIADRGIGIFEALRTTHKLLTPDDALRLSLLPGITSASNRATGSDWDNSGFGLYVTSELGRRYGEFAIISSNRVLYTNEGSIVMEQTPLNGTVVKLKVNTQDADYFPNILGSIVQEGEKIADELDGAVKSASKKSKTK